MSPPSPPPRRPVLASLLLASALLGASAAAQATAPLEPVPEQALAPAAWLAGCWAVTGRESGTVEQWMAPAVSENLAQDCPQRITYRQESPARALARIEGRREGKAVGVDFPMRRVACP